MKLSIFCPFGLKMPIHAPKIGVLGDFTPNTLSILNIVTMFSATMLIGQWSPNHRVWAITIMIMLTVITIHLENHKSRDISAAV